MFQVTPGDGWFSPVTVADASVSSPPSNVVAWALTVRPVTLELAGGGCTVRLTVPSLLGSSWLTAWMVTVVTAVTVGAVNGLFC